MNILCELISTECINYLELIFTKCIDYHENSEQ